MTKIPKEASEYFDFLEREGRVTPCEQCGGTTDFPLGRFCNKCNKIEEWERFLSVSKKEESPTYPDDARDNIVDLMNLLTDDLLESRKQILEADTQSGRRSHVRTAFAYIEGSLFAIKQLILHTQEEKLSDSEKNALKEISYDLTDKGILKETVMKIRTIANIHFTFALFSKVTGVDNLLVTSDTNWQLLPRANNIRNRITHPKNIRELHVSRDDLATVDRAAEFFGTQMTLMLAMASHRMQKEIEVLQSRAADMEKVIEEHKQALGLLGPALPEEDA